MNGDALIWLNLMVTVLGLLSVGFTLGSRIGKLEQRLDGHRELLQSRISQVEHDRQECEEREKQARQDHEKRLRDLETSGT